MDPNLEGLLWRTYSLQAVGLNVGVTYALVVTWYLYCGSGRRRIRMFRVTLLTFSLGFCLALLELPALAFKHNYELTFGNESTNTWLQLSTNINRPDPELIHIHWPHSHYRGEVVGNLVYFGIAPAKPHPFDLHYDHHGFRNDEDVDHAEVIVIGDSFIEANMIATSDTVVKQLERRLGLATVNLGQCGYGLRQELEVLRRFGRPLKPKLVLWFLFGGNDLRDVEKYERQREQYGAIQLARPLKYRLFTRNALVALSRMTTPPRSTSSERALKRSGLFTLANRAQERVYFGQTNGPWTPHQWQVTTDTLSEAKSICDQMNARFVTVFISRKFRLYRKWVTREPGSTVASWSVNENLCT